MVGQITIGQEVFPVASMTEAEAVNALSDDAHEAYMRKLMDDARLHYREETEQWLALAVGAKYSEGYPMDDAERVRCLGAAEDCAALATGAEVVWGEATAWRVTV